MQFMTLACFAGLLLVGSIVTVPASQDVEKAEAVEQKQKSDADIAKLRALLASEVGVWDADVRAWPGPNVPPAESKAVERTRMLGAWMISDLEGTVMGRPYFGHRVVGYDPGKRRYVGTWINTLSPGIVGLEGTWDAKSRTRTMHLPMRHPTTRKTVKAMLTTQYLADGKRVVSLRVPLPQGKTGHFPILEMQLTRRKPADRD